MNLNIHLNVICNIPYNLKIYHHIKREVGIAVVQVMLVSAL